MGKFDRKGDKDEQREEREVNDAYAYEAKCRSKMPKDSPAQCGYVPMPMDTEHMVIPARSDCDTLNEDHRWWLEREDAYDIKETK